MVAQRMKHASPLLQDFKSRAAAVTAAARLAEAALAQGLEARGKASIMVSGGTTPGPMLEALSIAPLDWSEIAVGLVDERCVPPTHAASNEALVRRTLMQNRAQAARFLPMWADGETSQQAVLRADALYAMESPFDFVLLGMGMDGHTASWFPGAGNLAGALHSTDRTIVSINAQGCPVAGDHFERLTLTRSAIVSAAQAVLLIFGEEKREIFVSSATKPVEERPVRSIVDGLDERLTVMWAP